MKSLHFLFATRGVIQGKGVVGRLFNGSASFSAFAACLLALHTARADALPPPDWVSSQVNEGGQHCVPLAEQRQADKLLLACGVAGVWEFALGEAAPRFVRSYSFAGEAVGFIAELITAFQGQSVPGYSVRQRVGRGTENGDSS